MVSTVERTCNCAVSSFVMDPEGRVRCQWCARPILGRSPSAATHVPDDPCAAEP